ncbi:heavy-metal-associated domain-containing protein [Amycolatopsis cihanbeyliensis]|uniref:Copper chaperone CopZ n=1 Tax=Amycolatopsis cihanbeyliensis TaxID=1128664 RepID=A0A542DFB1_AMYCI|nr:heavy-metal-associated domain-containing protein [Amycolatopsis cihanbeyliensis]TQJ01746.1 copper chaperone CopZ [Amycolatopsis cihanbeyliensis]
MGRVELDVRGMECGACEQRVAAVLKRVDGVRTATADHTSGRVEVSVGAKLPGRDVQVERIEAAGFEVVEEAMP